MSASRITPGYLVDAPTLPAHLLAALTARRPLTAEEEAELDVVLPALRLEVMERRKQWEAAHGPIAVEPPSGFVQLERLD